MTENQLDMFAEYMPKRAPYPVPFWVFSQGGFAVRIIAMTRVRAIKKARAECDMPTNDVFHHLLRLLQLHKDKDMVIDIFRAGGVNNITKSKISAWDAKTGTPARNYREMPKEALDAFINELYKRKLVSVEDENG